uniref:Uncharacterized protein n=1 Tax=Picea glauca TaxID=3330 RepID=A0A117NIY1_PICGL|nr:hypothetical protein ABT39_MTgene462 [Picea glauca]
MNGCFTATLWDPRNYLLSLIEEFQRSGDWNCLDFRNTAIPFLFIIKDLLAWVNRSLLAHL